MSLSTRLIAFGLLSAALAAPAAAQRSLWSFPQLPNFTAGNADVNKDAVPDFACGSLSFSGTSFVRVYSGKDGKTLATLNDRAQGDNFGWDVELADMNGDGYADILAGAIRADRDLTTADSGEVNCYSGKDFKLLFTLTGSAANDQFGRSIAVGDLNKDSVPDLVVGAWRGGANNTGYVTIYSGKDIADPKKRVVLQKIDGPADTVGKRFPFSFGVDVAIAGDVNKDNFVDVIIGAHALDNNSASPSVGNAGAAFIYSGFEIFRRVPAKLLVTHRGNQRFGSFGLRVIGIGDINGYSHSEYAIAQPSWDDTNTFSVGRVMVYNGKDSKVLSTYYGRRSGSGIGNGLDVADLNNDKINDIIVGQRDTVSGYWGTDIAAGTSRTRHSWWLPNSPIFHQAFGEGARFAGDIDNDGTPDVVDGSSSNAEWTVNVVSSNFRLAIDINKNWLSMSQFNRRVLNVNPSPLASSTQRQQSTMLLLGSISGMTPGITLNGVTLPLNLDAYTFLTLGGANSPQFQNTRQDLSQNRGFPSSRTMTLWTAPINQPSLVGQVVRHAYVLFNNNGGQWIAASKAVPIYLVK